ncbi:MAG TPA: hypothetical protein VLK36_17115 [Gaiellaceae bacterium]|nr:hypothetical protein [Gaiellaceae bacterium]
MRKVMLLGALLVVAVSGAAGLASAGVDRPAATQHRSTGSEQFAATLAKARIATSKYVTNLAAAKADGYQIITKMIPNMGIHYMNPKITGFDVTKPPILVYEKHGDAYQLGALEWVFPSKPATPPLPGARYGAFAAACHYADGTFVPEASQDACPKTAPGSGAAFGFWHPNLITLHVWLWYPNPLGLYSSLNPLVSPYNAG